MIEKTSGIAKSEGYKLCENILVVDDEKEIADLIEVYLKNENYVVHKYYNGTEALNSVNNIEFDMAILDIMLPDINGFTICKNIRKSYFFQLLCLLLKVKMWIKYLVSVLVQMII